MQDNIALAGLFMIFSTLIMQKYILFWLLVGWSIASIGQEKDSLANYHRSSLYSVLIRHPEKEFCNEIVEVFKTIPVPEKFNNHDLNRKVINASVQQKLKGKKNNIGQLENVKRFLVYNTIAKRLIAKWFNRNKNTGAFNMQLIAERGQYDADYFDVELARKTVRGIAMLEDAGEELIGRTFVIVNDIRYYDKEEAAALASGILDAISMVTDMIGSKTGNLISSSAHLGSTISDQIAGFRVIVTSYLFRLDWNNGISESFYDRYYFDENEVDSLKQQAFDREKSLFTLSFIGTQNVDSGKTTLKGVNKPEDMIRKVCTRAIDKSIAELQKNYEEFRVKTPIYSVEPEITAKIGKKEGVSEDSQFEVLEKYVDESGKANYRRKGVIKPLKGGIWDNRYMAAEEQTEGSELTVTYFKRVSGNNFYPGMLLREIK